MDSKNLNEDAFVVRVVSNNLTEETADAKIARVYTNNEPELLTSGSVEGEYVVIELDDFDKVGLVADLYYYEDTNGDTESISVRKDLMNCYDVRLVQQEDIWQLRKRL